MCRIDLFNLHSLYLMVFPLIYYFGQKTIHVDGLRKYTNIICTYNPSLPQEKCKMW